MKVRVCAIAWPEGRHKSSPDSLTRLAALVSRLTHWPHYLLGGLTDLIWPRTCGVCDRPLDSSDPPGSLCPDCRSAATADQTPSCPRCATPVGPYTDASQGCTRCRSLKLHFAGAVRLGGYDGVLREAVLRLKEESGERVAEELGRLLGAHRRDAILQHRPEAVVAIPLHWRRRWERGYNQSEAVARELARTLKLAHRSGWLRRIRPTSLQPAMTPAGRWENVRGAFRVSRFAAARVRGARMLLVDDVMTTGATADAAAQALLQGGAAQVTVAVLAHR